MTKPCPRLKTALAGVIALTLSMLLGACSQNTPTTEPTADATARIGVTIVATQNAPPTPVPSTSTPISQPANATQAPQAPSACPTVNTSIAPPDKPVTFTDTAAALTAYLDAGAGESAVLDTLKAWGDIYPSPTAKDQQLGAVVRARVLPGNDDQIVVIYYDPADQQTASRHGELIVYQCADAKLQMAYQATADPDFAGQVFNPRLFGVDDVTGDGLGDLSYVVGDCSENTCYDGIYIMTSVNGVLSNAIFEFQYEPFPTFTFVPAMQGAAKDLIVKMGYVGGPFAGPQRDITDTWSYVSSAFTLTQEVKEPPVYRIHALHDADEAFYRKDYATANALYQRVANDPDLQSWEGNAPLRDEPQVLAAFAYVRLMETAASAGDMGAVQAAHDALLMAAPDQSAGAIYAKLGETFFNAYSQTKNYQQACDATVKYAEKNENTYLILGQETFGTANYDYQPEDMCLVP